jgi:hypothetical protein
MIVHAYATLLPRGSDPALFEQSVVPKARKPWPNAASGCAKPNQRFFRRSGDNAPQ